MTDRWFAWIERLEQGDLIAVQCASAMAWLLVIYLVLWFAQYPGRERVRTGLKYTAMVVIASAAAVAILAWPLWWAIAILAVISGVVWLLWMLDTRQSQGGVNEL